MVRTRTAGETWTPVGDGTATIAVAFPADGRRVTDVELPPVTRLQRLVRNAGLPTGRSRRRAAADVALCWDEGTVERLVASAPGRRLFSGAIWVTDRLGIEDSERLAAHREVLASLDGLWCLSRPQVDAVRAWLGPEGPPVSYLQFGIDEQFYRFAPEYPERPKVVSLGGDRDRDPATLFAALELVRQERPDVECFVATTSSLPAPDGVRTVEFVPHARARDLYASASVVALATRPNLHASGMTVGLEALSVGRPVVACATPGMDDYFRDGETGFLVTPEDPAAMAARILELLADRHMAAAMGRHGREQVERGHTTAAMCRGLLEIVA
ncbi:glycosyltransferase family 4 protein [Blastococcus mobilis]|uniref:Glycosyl transferases group 1 n=1 Tax=Blastococcus mobilis TaxID=1938746 RepID=A0A238W733_9ACTN|nr:glycosyltransferase family 4 protein [Blastococcus mobilis]SNR41509.1 Glycosyl transferases group 1 [Blastococcus mobilis]